jgi:Cd2+/Zn2+-exporting ATPase
MLTGDNERAAAATANELPLSECYAELLPEDKVRHVEKLATAYKHVAMVGDGVNDAPAMARAQVGIAMGSAGSDVAIETADIALMHDDLWKVTYLIDLSKKTMSVVRENVTAAILIKASFAVLAFPGIITLWLAIGVGDMGLSLAVILNALRIGSKR